MNFQLDIYSISFDNIIAFIKIVAGSNFCCPTINMYISAIKAKCTKFDLNIKPWLYNQVVWMLKSSARTAVSSPSIKHVL